MDERPKRPKNACSEDCHLLKSTTPLVRPLNTEEKKLITQISDTFQTTPCLCYLFLSYTLNSDLTCSQIATFLSKASLPENQILYKETPKTTVIKNDIKQVYNPCGHFGSCKGNKQCRCYENKTYCEDTCMCRRCDLAFKACQCRVCGDKCPCFLASRECISRCNHICANMGMQLSRGKLTYVGESTVVGYGLFSGEDISKGSFVIEYTGELISHNEAERRGFFYDKKKSSYLFDLNVLNNSDYQTIDATRIGNNGRFINHSKQANIMARQSMVNGVLRMGMYALKNIKMGEELFFDYAYGDSVKEIYGLKD